MVLLWLASAFLAGDVAGSYLPGWPAAWYGVAVACACTAILGRGSRARSLLVLAVALSLGLGRSPHAPPSSPANAAWYVGRHVDLIGIVAAEPDVRETTVIYTVSLLTRQQSGHAHAVSGRIEVRTSASVQLAYGEKVEVRAVLHPIAGAARDYLLRQGVVGEVVFPRIADLGSTDANWRSTLVGLRQRIEVGIDRWLPEPHAALLIAITLGARSASLGDLAHPLVVTGLIHLIAISGIKVSLFAGMAYQLVQRVGRRSLSCAVPLFLLWSYVSITGFTGSGTRSAIMWTLVFVATALGRRTVTLVSLGTAVAVMVALQPELPWDTGFEMSALGTFFIVAFAGPIGRLTSRVPPPFRESFAVTIAAQLGTLPVVIAGFHVVSTIGPLSNALVLPLIPALIIIGFTIGLGAGVPLIAAPLAATAHTLCSVIAAIATFGASHSPPYSTATLAPAITAMYYAVLAGGALAVLRRQKWVPVGHYAGLAPQFALSGLVAVAGLSTYLVHANAPNTVRSLGTGESVLIQTHGQTILVDGSPRPFHFLEALGTAMPFGQRFVNVVIVTDPSSSNVLGLRALAARYQIGEVVDVGAQYPGATYAQWRDQLRRTHVPVYALRTGVSIHVGGAVLVGLGPDGLCGTSANCAGMLRVTLGGKSYVLAGPASLREQHEAVFRSIRIHANVLLTGSRSLDPEFLRAVSPRTIIHLNPKR